MNNVKPARNLSYVVFDCVACKRQPYFRNLFPTGIVYIFCKSCSITVKNTNEATASYFWNKEMKRLGDKIIFRKVIVEKYR